MKNFKKICSVIKLVPRTILSMILILWCVAPYSAFAILAERDNFIILGRSVEDSEGKSVLMEEKIILRTAPDINSQEQGRLDSGSLVLVLDKVQFETETFYLVMKVGQSGGLSGWVSEDYIYNITTEPQRE